jgi:putative ABC transport system ATP-binding protein
MLEINNISKRYKNGSEEFTALDGVTIKIEKGDYIAVTGASGAGKSTLLYAIGGLIHPDSGQVIYDGKDIFNGGIKSADDYRKRHVGFMFQQFHLMPYLTVLGNIKLACRNKVHVASVDRFLEICSLTALKNKLPSRLSVGEKQRVAFIRAIITEPGILLADEPTGNLDPANGSILMSLIEDYHKSGGTVILVSHNPDASKFSTRTIILEKGRIVP